MRALKINSSSSHSDATRFLTLPDLPMYRGHILKTPCLAYETWGELNKEKSNAVLVFTGLSPSAHAASSPHNPQPGWWEYMIGAGKPIDTEKYHVICVNSLGSCFGSTGPASIHPATGQYYRMQFPPLSIEDIASSTHGLLQGLGIGQAHVVGASLGGMSALAFSAMYPHAVAQIAVISAAFQSTPFAIAIRSMQRDIITSDPAWQQGHYPLDRQPVDGMRLARKLGITSYRSPQEWHKRFGRAPLETASDEAFTGNFAIESYLEHNAGKFANRFDANCYLYLSRAMDWFDFAEHGQGNLLQAAKSVSAQRILVIGVESDMLFPLWQQQNIADTFKQAGTVSHFVALPSIQGHDAFLVDEHHFAPVIGDFFS